MATIERFEDIDAWKQARQLTKAIYQITAEGAFARDFGLRDQIRRASVSIMSNIAEGYERDGNREFQHFLALAKGSAGEVKAQLYVALDAGFITGAEFRTLYDLTSRVAKMIAGFMRYLSNSDYKGNRFKEFGVLYSVRDDTPAEYSKDEPETRNPEPGTDK